jgi:hypothetical protein
MQRVEEVRQVNQFSKSSWLNQSFGEDSFRERRSDIEELFAGRTTTDKAMIKKLEPTNKGEYVAFRAIVHGYTVWEKEVLQRCAKQYSIG